MHFCNSHDSTASCATSTLIKTVKSCRLHPKVNRHIYTSVCAVVCLVVLTYSILKVMELDEPNVFGLPSMPRHFYEALCRGILRTMSPYPFKTKEALVTCCLWANQKPAMFMCIHNDESGYQFPASKPSIHGYSVPMRRASAAAVAQHNSYAGRWYTM